MQDALCRPFTSRDVKEALWNIDDDKAPGPDGFSSKFFKASWAIVGEDITKGVLDFFSSSKMLKQIKNTILTMVPTVDCAEEISQFRPIAYWEVNS
uniref:RNA-directed DNA polymerase, eukaryota, reverse transcriptase zinc-binding domain protein n=1 Tax=Chenopodium quinoa TaxID=63459 RepID=A0A803N4X5_CHEQI